MEKQLLFGQAKLLQPCSRVAALHSSARGAAPGDLWAQGPPAGPGPAWRLHSGCFKTSFLCMGVGSRFVPDVAFGPGLVAAQAPLAFIRQCQSYSQLAEREPEALCSQMPAGSHDSLRACAGLSEGPSWNHCIDETCQEEIETVHPLGVLEPSLSEKRRYF